jgi:hypothetical protein
MLGMSMMDSCLDPYPAPASVSHISYLVVEGFFSTGNGPTVIGLSRTSPLASGDIRIPEAKATVIIQDNQGGTYSLTETESGFYSALPLVIDPDKTYRLKIKTTSNKEYASDFVPFKQTPVIDSVSWAVDGNDLHIYANAHDDNNNTHYYLWKYDETWAYHSAFPSQFKFVGGKIIPRGADDVFYCWRTLYSTQILISSSARLARDFISQYAVETLPLTSQKTQSEYSILLHQFALTKDGFEYWQQLKKNTENVGTIFGPQPSQIVSNIRCTTNPEEPVIGFFSACSIQQKRIFIFNGDLPRRRHETGYESCEQDTLFTAQIPSYGGGDLLTTAITGGRPPVTIGYLKSSTDCVDCRVHGGTTIKPYFWK